MREGTDKIIKIYTLSINTPKIYTLMPLIIRSMYTYICRYGCIDIYALDCTNVLKYTALVQIMN